MIQLSIARHKTLAFTNPTASTVAPTPVATTTSAPAINLAVTTPTLSYPTLTLESPAPGATIVGQEKTEFSWHWDGDLQEGERFDLRIWRPDKSPFTFVVGRELSVLLDTPPYGFGEYLWQVAVVQIDKSGRKLVLSESQVQRFVWKPEAEVVCRGGLNFRAGPGTDYRIIGALRNGDALDIRGRIASNRWIQIVPDDSGTLGWASALPQYVQINVDLDTTPIVEPPPLPTPKKPHDAVVIAPGGVLPLLSGPEDNYDLIHTLTDGTVLDVLRRVYYKETWIKVAVNPDSNARAEGYVDIASGLIEVNVDLDDLPPIYEFGPPLLVPEKPVQRAIDGLVEFEWQDSVVLEEHQYYSLRIYLHDHSLKDACYHDQHKVSEVLIRPEDYDKCTPGLYYWEVGIATKILGEDSNPILGEDGNPIWRDDSERDHRRLIDLDMPPPTDEDGEDGGELPPDI